MPKIRDSKEKDKENKLAYKAKAVWDLYSEAEKKESFSYAEGYKAFLSAAKTEREAVRAIARFAEERGFKPLEKINRRLKPGDRVYAVNREKNAALVIIGEEPVTAGINVVGSHIDSPRLDLKPVPLYEDSLMALAKTHYYGGIKKYQWTAAPMALHGVVITASEKKIELCIGEEPGDPVFTITDLLPHLAKKQMDKKLGDAIPGEDLHILLGSLPKGDEDKKDRVKNAILEYLYEKYGIEEEDFISAELEVVPAGPARDVGLDRSMVGSYGQDDRICAYTSMTALDDVKKPKHTAMALFVDKEEIGSSGTTGMEARFFENCVAELIFATEGKYNELLCRRALVASRALSADVNAALDPLYQDAFDKMNASRLGYGVVLSKYTGSGGKYSANDSSAEFVGFIRRMFNENNIAWQIGELGKVDLGGGGTIAKLIARYGMEVIDCGVAILSMHAPLEIASKADLYMAHKAFEVFYKS